MSLRFLSEEGNALLRVVVDKYQLIISLDEIVKISELIDPLIENEEDETLPLM